MKNGKTPGLDSIRVEFYKKFWHIIGVDFVMILNKFVNCRQEMEWKSFKQAYITLIYKKSDPTDIRNYRPISLLNVDYKIVNKFTQIIFLLFYQSFWDQCSMPSRAEMFLMGLFF